MQQIIHENLKRNGNGAGALNARGIPHRGWTLEQRVAAAVDAVLGAIHVVPSIGQAAGAFYVSPAAIRAELKARAAAQAAVITDPEVMIEEAPTNGAAEEATGSATATMPDTPAMRVALRRWAASLGCEIALLEGATESGMDRGPYVLMDVASNKMILEFGLPIEGVADALRCLAREHCFPDHVEQAWADFGKTWL